MVVAVKALACSIPRQCGLPISRFSMAEIQRQVIESGIVASIGETTLWRWLSEDAIRPWYHRSWIFPRDPLFEEKAGKILDLYAGSWDGRALGDRDFVISTDEKTSIQARRRIHPSLAPGPGEHMRVENEYKRLGAWAYLAAWDVRRAKIFGCCELKTGIRPFQDLVQQVMSQEPYASARRVFWIMDNASSHRGRPCALRLKELWPSIIPVHTPVHASWLNQIEIYFSIIQRKVLTPNDFKSLEALKTALLDYQAYYETLARPFDWRFTRTDLKRLMNKLQTNGCFLVKAA